MIKNVLKIIWTYSIIILSNWKINKYFNKKGVNKMYDVLDVSRYVINYSNDKNYNISNLKLQKLLYFIQAFFVVMKNGTPCFSERIEAWNFGPVVPEAYREFKCYGSGSIPYIHSYLVFDGGSLWNLHRKEFDKGVLKKEDRDRICKVVDTFAKYTATDLVGLTHRQAPWKKAYRPQENNEITLESIREYFDV